LTRIALVILLTWPPGTAHFAAVGGFKLGSRRLALLKADCADGLSFSLRRGCRVFRSAPGCSCSEYPVFYRAGFRKDLRTSHAIVVTHLGPKRNLKYEKIASDG